MASGIESLEQRLSDAALRQRSGRGWQEWFALLDASGATGKSHTVIARWLRDEHGIDNWSAQSVTVGYEQARGIRVPGQGADGHFSASVSKTITAPLDALYAAFADEQLRDQWLSGIALTVRTPVPGKTFRADVTGGPDLPGTLGRIAVGFVDKGNGRSMVGLLHEKLTDPDMAARMKLFWRERLAALQALIGKA